MTESLRIPFCINIRSIPERDIDALLDCLENDLGGLYFRDRSLFCDVLADRLARAAQPSNFLHGPYIRLTFVQNGALCITSVDSVPGGDTVYALDQLAAALAPVASTNSVNSPRMRG